MKYVYARPFFARQFCARLAIALGLSLGVGISGLSPAWAVEPVQQQNASALWFENWTGLSNATLTVVRPDGQIDNIFAEAGTPVYQLVSGAIDGPYSYDLTAATDKTKAVVNQTDNGRGDAAASRMAVAYSMSGSFVVLDGAIVSTAAQEITEE